MKMKSYILIGAACLVIMPGGVFAKQSARMADQAKEPAPDPKKKNPGDECKSSDECQKHHACKKEGEKNICVQPPRPQLPSGAVTFSGQRLLLVGSMMQPPHDPKKKKAGDECTSSDECQKHHSCKPSGDKSFCTAPPAPKLPPGVVT